MKNAKKCWMHAVAGAMIMSTALLGWSAKAQVQSQAQAQAQAQVQVPQPSQSTPGLLSYEMSMTQSELQARIDAMSPIKVEKFRVVVALSAPKIELSEGSSLFALSSPVEVSLPGGMAAKAGESIRGFAKIKGSLRYDASAGAFFVEQADVVEFEINGLPEEHKGRARALAQVAARRAFAERPVYVLRDDSVKQRLARAVLKSVVVKNGKLVATLGF